MCGWPQHMLLPKGSADGYPFRIFVMISDYNIDKVIKSLISLEIRYFFEKKPFHFYSKVEQSPPNGVCNDNYVLCGLRNRKYPDKRSMGYPFDRPASQDVMLFEDFTTGQDNMISKKITIRHLDENQAQSGDDPNNTIKITN